jgi:ABC-type transporter Mla maintaining outer membrane lipid asymmetry ATPase subunit MlaF
MNDTPILELADVTVPARRNAEAPSVEHVSWAVKEGEFWVIGGLQGSGKSDFTFMLAGLTKPLAGSFRLFGDDMARHFGDESLPNRLRIAMVFDDARLFGPRTIAENVALPARYHHNLSPAESAAWVEALLKETGVTEFASDMPASLSRTWRRRVALARALALKPEVVVLENPLRGLDRWHAAWWVRFAMNLVRGHPLMNGRPVTVIASTDEYWPWRNSGATFARLDREGFAVVGRTAPVDDTQFELAEAGSGEQNNRDEND